MGCRGSVGGDSVLREGGSAGVGGVVVVDWGGFVVVAFIRWVLVHCRQKVRESVGDSVCVTATRHGALQMRQVGVWVWLGLCVLGCVCLAVSPCE